MHRLGDLRFAQCRVPDLDLVELALPEVEAGRVEVGPCTDNELAGDVVAETKVLDERDRAVEVTLHG